MTPHDELEELLGAYAVCFGRPILRKKLHALLDRQQAKIDALMMEYCQEEITPEQYEEWKKHQRPADNRLIAIDAAINVQGVGT
jgi:hypothetical protein